MRVETKFGTQFNKSIVPKVNIQLEENRFKPRKMKRVRAFSKNKKVKKINNDKLPLQLENKEEKK